MKEARGFLVWKRGVLGTDGVEGVEGSADETRRKEKLRL